MGEMNIPFFGSLYVRKDGIAMRNQGKVVYLSNHAASQYQPMSRPTRFWGVEFVQAVIA